MSLYIYTAASKVHEIAVGSSVKRSPPGGLPVGLHHISWTCMECAYIGSLQFDLAQACKVHFSECSTSSPSGSMPPRPLRHSEVVSPSQNDRVDLENLSSCWQGVELHSCQGCHCLSDTRERERNRE